MRESEEQQATKYEELFDKKLTRQQKRAFKKPKRLKFKKL